jgi:4-amino-4-deoxychorismate lyase
VTDATAIWVDGRQGDSVPATDRGLYFGDGVFETIRVRDGMPEYLDHHLDRLADGLDRLGILPVPADTLREEARRISRGTRDSVLKIIVTRGDGGRGYATPSRPRPRRVLMLGPRRGRPVSEYEHGAAVRWCETRLALNPGLAGIKHLNRLEQVLALAEWNDPGIAEGLVRDTEGRVAEATAANLFLVERGRLVTPDLTACGVAGVMRAVVMAAARRDGLEVLCETVYPDRVAGADELFVTNSLIGILPVGRLETESYPVGPVTRRLMEKLSGHE